MTRPSKRLCGRNNIIKKNTAGNKSPVAQGNLPGALGFMGEKSEVIDVINGMFNFPEDCDKHARQKFKEACRIYVKAAQETINSFITKNQFQLWWRAVNEDIRLSIKSIHFSYLQTEAWDGFLDTLRTAKLNACLVTGIPLK